MTTESKGNVQNDSACSSQSTTSLPPCKSLHAPPHLPFDLVVEILCRLSVKHLLQLRCICKSWNSLISHDSKFSKKHLRFSTSSHDCHHLFLAPVHLSHYPSHEFLLLCSPISSIFTSTLSSTTTTVKHSNYSITEILAIGAYGIRASTCDGIVCFQLNNSSAMLCNPSIRKFKMLPPLIFPHKIFDHILYTLVYDRFTNNYKIIALNTISSKIEASVHTLGTDYWRRIQDFPGPDLIPLSRLGTFVNDSVNWLTCDSDCCAMFIVSLDLEKESYQKLSLPSDIISYISLGTLRGCLSLLFRSGDNFEVWIMKEYGNEKSWIKILSVPPMVVYDFRGYTKALYISEDDKVLMECLKRGGISLVVYDSINNTFEIPKFENNIHGEMVVQGVYVESLISPF